MKIKIDILKMIFNAGGGHPAGAMGMSDIFASLYFGHILKFQANNPKWSKRDYLVLSNGHICPVLYATLAESGFFSQQELATFRTFGSRLQGHPSFGYLPGVENTSGPLGQGLSQAVGICLGLKMDKKDNHVFCITSDGEHQEGQTWEAYMLAAKYKLNNLTVIIDNNNIQIGGYTNQIMPVEPLKYKLASFGFDVSEINGHDLDQIFTALSRAKTGTSPLAIIAQTTPGKGVSFMENNPHWHGKAPNQEQYDQAQAELEKQLNIYE